VAVENDKSSRQEIKLFQKGKRILETKKQLGLLGYFFDHRLTAFTVEMIIK
jgi:vacuolar-type H+-ATPase subunit D/Vma8